MVLALRAVGVALVAILITIGTPVRAQTGAAVARCESCRLRFELRADKVTYEVGEPIVLAIRLANVGTTQIQVQHTSDISGRHDGYRFEVFDEAAHQLPDPGNAAISLLGGLEGTVSVAPGRADSRQLTLNYQVAVLKPGRYSIKGVFDSSYPQSGVHAESNSLAINIQPTPAGHLRQRVNSLVQNVDSDPGAVAPYLGFTGDETAIPPLVDLLYHKDDHVQVAALDALLYLDRGAVEQSLLDAVRDRGPRERIVYFLIEGRAIPNALIRPLLIQGLRSADAAARMGAVEGLRLSNPENDPELLAPLVAMLVTQWQTSGTKRPLLLAVSATERRSRHSRRSSTILTTPSASRRRFARAGLRRPQRSAATHAVRPSKCCGEPPNPIAELSPNAPASG
jgi:hypothetical protein